MNKKVLAGPMKIRVRDIPEEGADFHEEVEAPAIGLASGPSYQYKGPLTVDARLEKTTTTLIVRTRVAGAFEFFCSRCLEPIRKERTERFELFFDIDPKTDFVDIAEDVRQEIIVALSSLTFLCKDDCRGLCPTCGVNRNREACRCPAEKSSIARQLDKL